jgi:hypothetical protein
VRIRSADPREGEQLRAIALASKAHWGYDAQRVRAWAERGDFSARGLTEGEVYVADSKGRPVA